MHSTITHTFLAITALGLVTSPLVAAPKSHVKERGELTMTAALVPPATAPSEASGTAEIHVVKPKFKSEETATLSLILTGLTAGNYSADASLKDASIVHLADVVVDPVVPPTPTSEPPVVIDLPAGFDVSSIAKITVSDATPAVVLEGELVDGNVTWKYIANVRVTGPETLLEKGSKSKSKKSPDGQFSKKI